MTSSARAASATPVQSSHTRHGAARRQDGTRGTIECTRITDELRERLNQHALSRKVFSQLAVLEQEFKRLGYRCLESLPLEFLETALEQLVVVMGRAPGEWGTLRTKLLDTILAHEPRAGAAGGGPAVSVFNAANRLPIADATEVSFMHAEQERAQRGSPMEHRVLGSAASTI